MDTGIAALECLSCPRDQTDSICFSGSDIDVAHDDIITYADLIFCSSDQIQDFFCQSHFAGTFRPAYEKLLSEFSFQTLDLSGECGLRKVKAFRSVYDALFPCNGKKII